MALEMKDEDWRRESEENVQDRRKPQPPHRSSSVKGIGRRGGQKDSASLTTRPGREHLLLKATRKRGYSLEGTQEDSVS